eukprot:358500-Pelagomonas_calceolata.AAC.2
MQSGLHGLPRCPRATGTLPMHAGTRTQMRGAGSEAVFSVLRFMHWLGHESRWKHVCLTCEGHKGAGPLGPRMW